MRNIHTHRERQNCNVCHRTFRNSATLRTHINAMHEPGERPRFSCTFPDCEKIYLAKGELTRHVAGEHSENPVNFVCTLCHKEFKYKINRDVHIRRHTTEKPFNCGTCGRRFAGTNDLKRHEVLKLIPDSKYFDRHP